ncbi:MAG: GNAT family N-acetyltransferase [Gimesia chilikensis]|uniref:GNAT family N-acetyltransferase n=1 Tax=Gimesia chilikensis TaxID=2605989 RepID=UPI0037A1F63A
MSGPNLDIIEINEINGLIQFCNDWNRLLAATPGGNFFQSFNWLKVYWQHFHQKQFLRVFVVREAGEVTGIVPLCVRRIKTKMGTCSILTYPFDDWGSFYGPVSANPEATLNCVLKYVQQTQRDWDLIDLRCVDTDGFDGGATERALDAAGLACAKFEWSQTYYVDLQQNWDDYLATRSGKARQTFRRAEKRVAEEGTVEYLRYRPRGEKCGESDPRWDLYDTCEEIASNSWQGSSTTGTTLSHEDVAQYFRDTHESAARFGSVDLNLLYLSGQPAAFIYNYVHQGIVYSLRMGFNPDISNKGLGRLLMGQMLRDSMERGDRIYDIGPGSPDAKKYWYTSVENSYRYVHYSSESKKAKMLQISNRIANWYRRHKQDHQPNSLSSKDAQTSVSG